MDITCAVVRFSPGTKITPAARSMRQDHGFAVNMSRVRLKYVHNSNPTIKRLLMKINSIGEEPSMKKRMKANRVVVVVVSVFCFFFVLEAQAFRCGDEIVGTGDSRAKVLIKCGKPTHKEKGGAKKSTQAKGDKRTAADKRQSYEKKQTAEKTVEKWYYNCGKDDFIYVLTFEGGVVTRKDTDGRGRGASECLGR
ncbi:MAG: hypothetical protein C0394_04875 [Syntrophus sp. (in: bacteria)]|nr:hypothetical protein [Syntrophus sp. (in: bacteria)]